MKPGKYWCVHFGLIAVVLTTMFWSGFALAQDVLNIYSHRHYGVDAEVNALFTERTGIEVRVVNADADQLIERLKSEGENSPADVLVTVDAGRLQIAKNEGLLQPLNSEVLMAATPEGLRDSEGYWYPFTARARVIMVADDRVAEGAITRYEQLGDDQWRGRVAIRSSSSAYNQALVASIVAANGVDTTQEWADGVVSNMARPPQGGDRDQIRAVASGLADVCVANAYYLGIMLNSPEEADRALAEKVRVVFPNQQDRGAHFNVSAIGVTRHAKNFDAARLYMEFLVSPEIQQKIAESTHEYPISLDFSATPTLERWGEFKVDTESFPGIGEHLDDASAVFDQSGWQ
ncbi:MAG TPA: extracellular solute-binding protein [Xanthomonadales bacterium]|nr:extracellular solute-binding protein [Xanthomonadales bacterium]